MQTLKDVMWKECFSLGGFISFTQIYDKMVEKTGSPALPPQEVRNVLAKMMPEKDIYFDDNPKSRLYKVRNELKW